MHFLTNTPAIMPAKETAMYPHERYPFLPAPHLNDYFDSYLEEIIAKAQQLINVYFDEYRAEDTACGWQSEDGGLIHEIIQNHADATLIQQMREHRLYPLLTVPRSENGYAAK